VPAGICAFHHIDDWYDQNKASFSPPVCNKLMHKGQLSIMFVGGPNTRKDFHLEEGSEFFLQLRGDMELPTVQRGRKKVVKIKAGQVFCLPSRIPHSPQRPMEGSLGLVIERQREARELDGLVFYRDFATCDEVMWERFFACKDLGTDLPPVIRAFKEFEATPEAEKKWEGKEADRPVRQDVQTEVPAPFFLEDLLMASAEKLAAGKAVSLLGNSHPDREFQAHAVGGPSEQRGQTSALETWLYQIRGTAHIAMDSGTLALTEGCCCIVEAGKSFDVVRSAGSVGLIIRQDPKGNKGTSESPEERDVEAAVGTQPYSNQGSLIKLLEQLA